jgi:glycosyltransferase involved in cell wall biosynthesis
MQPLVSIITPTYNQDEFIGKAIESVLSQTYQNWEQIIIDDGSQDNTINIVEEFANKDPRIKFIKQNHKGIEKLSEIYNLALKNAKGSIIAILEGDDFWPSNKLANQIVLHDENTVFSYGIAAIYKNNNVIGYYKPNYFEKQISSREFLKYMLLSKSMIQPVTVLINSSKLRIVGGFLQHDFPAIDFPTFIRLSQIPGNIVFSSKILGYWRQHHNQVTSLRGIELSEKRLQISLYEFNKLEKEVRKELAINQKAIEHAHKHNLSDSYFFALRKALISKNCQETKKYLIEVFKYGNTKRKSQALLAILFMMLGLNFEEILSLYSKLFMNNSKDENQK